MFQNTLNTTLTNAQAKALESAQTIATLTVQSAEAIAEINYDVAKEVVSAAQASSAKLIQLKDPKDALQMFDAETAKEAAAQVVGYQNKVNKVLRKNSKEVASLVDSAIDDSKADLEKFVKEATAQAPAGSEAFVSAFNSVFEATLKGFDQVRASSHDAYANFEKTMDSAMSSFQGQVAPAAKSRKQIAA
ncbi:phasin family protein [Polynucleobacter sp. 15G-AUS-farblos]|uniref:phasin family protein n=1 Tax=Polynucleobacter sp. 15G-AUS-farblos TaxID=2689094 RepID=UPI001C0BCB0F|nr:phasin family protein [Polynucleobacter sp. 15G-AUS-farblos]MBU3583165.1 phasin family protein [Polynucleobacter sp. 15G-AUS-farblos]